MSRPARARRPERGFAGAAPQLPRALAAFFLCLWSCLAVQPATGQSREATSYRIWVAATGWHTAIILSRAEAAATRLLPETADFVNVAYLEFGWGDRRYYTAEDQSVGLALEAALAPSPSVMHVGGYTQSPESLYAQRRLLAMELSETQFRRLLRSISQDIERGGAERAEPFAQGLWPNSRFYEASGRFHLFNTCNTWTAEKLRAAGLPLSSFGVITTGDLMARLGSRPALERSFSP